MSECFLSQALKIIKDSFIYLIYHKDLRIKLTKINDFSHVICVCIFVGGLMYDSTYKTYIPLKHSDTKEIGNNGRSVGTKFFSLVGPKKAFYSGVEILYMSGLVYHIR